MRKWFCIGWYSYLWSSDSWKQVWCRIRNHPCGVTFFNYSGLEPDMHCRNCGEDLG